MYWFVGLTSSVEQFFTFYLVTYLMTVNGVSLGLMLGSIIHDQKSVSVAIPIIMLPMIIFSGLFKNTETLSVWIGWLQYLSPIKYRFSALIHN